MDYPKTAKFQPSAACDACDIYQVWLTVSQCGTIQIRATARQVSAVYWIEIHVLKPTNPQARPGEESEIRQGM